MSNVHFNLEAEILEILQQNNIKSLWHFTDINNLPLIKKLEGLKSKEFLENTGRLNDILCGGNDKSHCLDKQLDNWNKISLSFTPHIPMVYHIKKDKHLVFIEINTEVATLDGVYFTDTNAARIRDGQKREKGIKGLENVKFEYINSPPKPSDPNWKKFVQAEILVPDCVPLRYFKKIYFVSNASLHFGQSLWGTNSSSLFEINKQVFADYNLNQQDYINLNPYIESVIITHEEITKNNFQNHHTNSKEIEKGKDFWIKISLFTNTGTKGKIVLKDLSNHVFCNKELEFKTSGDLYWFPNFKLPSNIFSSFIVEVFLDGILWFKSERRVK